MTTLLPERQRTSERGLRIMRAAVIAGPGEVRIEEVPLPEPGEGEVRVRMRGCGVCASNLGPWAGPDWMTFPTQPGDLGHEAWGIVDAVGSGVKGLREGDEVATLFYRSYAQYDVGPASAVVKLPASIAGTVFPGEPVACAMNIFRRSDIRPGQRVAIIGIGFLGAILTRLASLAGAEVVAISRRPFALEVGQMMGAMRTIELDDRTLVREKVDDLLSGNLFERVIEATGKQMPLDVAGDIIAECGRLIIAGYHQDGPRMIDMQQWNWRGIDVVNAHERDQRIYHRGLREAVQAVEEGRILLEPLLTHTFSLERLGDALDATRDRRDGFLKATVTIA